MMGLQFGFLLGGSIVVEKVFNWPGLGRLLVDAVDMRDYPVIQALVLLFSLEFILINLVVDVLYGRHQPDDPVPLMRSPLRPSPQVRDRTRAHAMVGVLAQVPAPEGRAGRRRIRRCCWSSSPIAAPWIVPYDAENYFDYDALNAAPSLAHWFGVDSLGRDIFSRILMGARISLAAGFLSVAVGAIVGTVLGLVAGYYEGWWDRIIMRICDVLFAFPGILLAIGIVAILGGGMANVIVAVAIFSIPTFARLVRGNTLALKHLTYVEAARSLGASDCDDHPAPHLSRHDLRGRRLLLAAHRHLDHHRGEPVVPRHGRAAADPGMGRDAQCRALGHDDGAARRDLSRARDLPHRARVQPAGRRAARRARPQDRAALIQRSLRTTPSCS